MPGLCRVGDMGSGTCCCHSKPTCIPMTGIIVSGVPSISVESSPMGTVTGIVIGGCGHSGIIVSGMPSATSPTGAPSRVTDSFVGCFSGILITGASTTIG